MRQTRRYDMAVFRRWDPVCAVSAMHAETAFLPVDQVIEPVEERNPKDHVRVHGCYAQVHVESDRVHGHVDVHKLCAGDCVAGCGCEGLAFVQSVAFEVEFACYAIGNKIRAGFAVY